MSNVNIDDPIELEEKTLDLRYRSRRLEKELLLLRKVNGDLGNRVRQGKNPQESRMADKIKSLENQLETKIANNQNEKLELEEKIKA